MPRTDKQRATDPKSSKRDQDAQRGTPTRGGSKATTTARAETTTKTTTKSSSASRKDADKEATSSKVSGQKPAKKR